MGVNLHIEHPGALLAGIATLRTLFEHLPLETKVDDPSYATLTALLAALQQHPADDTVQQQACEARARERTRPLRAAPGRLARGRRRRMTAHWC